MPHQGSHISPEYGAYLNLDVKMIARVPIIDSKMNLKLSQESLHRVYLDHQCGIFKIDNALMYKILLKLLMGMGA